VGSFAESNMSVAWMLGADGLPCTIDPRREALVWESGSRTYEELRRRALGLAAAFRRRGLRRGDRVACMLFNRGEIFELYFGCAYAGVTFVPLNFRLSEKELDGILGDAEPALFFTDEELEPLVRTVTAAKGSAVQVVVLGSDEGGAEYEQMAAEPSLAGPYETSDPHLLMFSSGTTGRPKGICLSHRNVLTYAVAQTLVIPGLSQDAVSLVVPPLFNMAGINELSNATLAAGGTVAILPSRGWSPRRMSDYIDRWKATHAIIFPTMIQPMLEADAQHPFGLESMRHAGIGGEQTPDLLMRRFHERWPHIGRAIGYGLSEGGLITHILDDDIVAHPGSVGRAVPYQTMKVIGPDGQDLPRGERGEICTAGDAVMSGYWHAPELTAEAIVDGWLRTGDIGRIDDEGYLYIEGRKRDLIISKGQNVYPAEIEDVLLDHPSVRLAAVVGVSDDEFGEAVCAVLVLHPGAELAAEDCIAYVGEHIASYKKPRHVVYRDELPLSVNNKVLKRELAKEIVGELERRKAVRAKAPA
jgi:fatty-acyl-CoA synthase